MSSLPGRSCGPTTSEPVSSKSDPFLLLRELSWLNLHLPWPLVTRKPCPWEIKGRANSPTHHLPVYWQVKWVVPHPRHKRGRASSRKGVLGAKTAPNCPAKGRTRSSVCSAAGHGTRSVQPHVLRGGSRLGMLSGTFGSGWYFYFPNNFWETVPSTLIHEIWPSLCLHQVALPNRQHGEEGRWGKTNAWRYDM